MILLCTTYMSLVIDVFHLLSLYRALLSRTPRLASVSFSSASSVLTSRLLSNARLLIRLGWDPAYLKLPLSISQTSRKVPVDSELWLSFRFGPGFELRPVSKNSKSIDSLSEIICVIFSTLKQEIHSLFYDIYGVPIFLMTVYYASFIFQLETSPH